ncbi:unnamed protein product, partial [Amoebophrya sp. A25]
VIRDGENVSISRYDLVVGDVVRLSIGDILEGDGLFIQGFDVSTDESALTGEPVAIPKSVDAPWILSGTSIQNGQGTYLQSEQRSGPKRSARSAGGGGEGADTRDTAASARSSEQQAGVTAPSGGDGGAAVGASDRSVCEAASVPQQEHADASSVSESKTNEARHEEVQHFEEEEDSLLTKKLNVAATTIGKIATAVALVAFAAMILRWLARKWVFDSLPDDKDHFGTEFVQWLITTVTIIVVAVPEGLPLAVTLALSLSVHKMQKDACLVKHLDATETMGSATSICTDKTGALTQNRMT